MTTSHTHTYTHTHTHMHTHTHAHARTHTHTPAKYIKIWWLVGSFPGDGGEGWWVHVLVAKVTKGRGV